MSEEIGALVFITVIIIVVGFAITIPQTTRKGILIIQSVMWFLVYALWFLEFDAPFRDHDVVSVILVPIVRTLLSGSVIFLENALVIIPGIIVLFWIVIYVSDRRRVSETEQEED